MSNLSSFFSRALEFTLETGTIPQTKVYIIYNKLTNINRQNILRVYSFRRVACPIYNGIWLTSQEDSGFYHLYINFVCLSVRLHPITDKTAEPIGPKFVVGPRVTPGRVYGWSNFQVRPIKILFWKFWKSKILFIKSAKFLFVFVLQCTVKPLITITSKEFIKCRILHFLIMLQIFSFLIKWLYGTF